MNGPVHIELFANVAYETQQASISPNFKYEKALRCANKLERILMEPENAILRNRIIELAMERNLYCDISDRSDYYFRMLTSIPGMRKFDGFKVFPAAMLNYYDTAENKHSYFFHSPAYITPKLEIIKLGTQPCTVEGQKKKIPFLFFRVGNSNAIVSKELNMGLFNLKTVGMSYKNLVTNVDEKILKRFAFYEIFASLLGQTVNFKVDELRPDEIEYATTLPQMQYTVNGGIFYNRQPFGTKSNLFGFYTQRFAPAESIFYDHGIPIAVRYDHNGNYNKHFIVWAKKCSPKYNSYHMTANEELYIHDIYITVDTLAHSDPPPYEEVAEDVKPNGGLFSSLPEKSKQKVIVDLGSDRYLCTTVEIL